MRGILIVAVVVAGLGACSSDSPTTRSCRSDGGFEFTTAMASCAEAVRAGQELTVKMRIATATGTEAADLFFALECAAMQGGEPRSGTPAEVGLARLLNDQGVCPGDTSRVTSD